MRDMLKMGTRLLIICAVAGLCLAGTYGFTNPKIKAQEAEKQAQAYRSLFAQAVSFDKVAYDTAAHPTVNEVVAAKDASGALLGYCINVTGKGYKGSIVLNMGVDVNGVMKGLVVGSHSETQGLGAKITEPAFSDQFTGKKAPLTLGQEIEAISGATISSRAVTAAVNAGAQCAASLQ